MSSWSNLYKCRIFEYDWSRRKCSTKIFYAWPFWFASSEFKLQVIVLLIKWVDYAIWLHILLIMQHLFSSNLGCCQIDLTLNIKLQTGYVNSGKIWFFFSITFLKLVSNSLPTKKIFNLKSLSLILTRMFRLSSFI